MSARRIALIAVLMASCSAVSAQCGDQDSLRSFRAKGFKLKGPLDVEEVERRNTVELHEGGMVRTVVFGALNREWRALRAKQSSGDVFFYFKSDPATWSGGTEGYVLVRDECVVHGIVTVRN
jgi:hypothetical protein